MTKQADFFVSDGVRGTTFLPDIVDAFQAYDSGDRRWDGVPDWHLPNGFASWRNGTHAFVFGGQQSGMALDTQEPEQSGDILCNDVAGVM